MKKDRWGNMKPNYDGYSVTDTTLMKKYETYCSQPGINTVALSKRDVKNRLRKEYRVIVEGRRLTGIRIKGRTIEDTQPEEPEHEEYEHEEYCGGRSIFDTDGDDIEFTVSWSDEEATAEATA
jgi:hypothetical protein